MTKEQLTRAIKSPAGTALREYVRQELDAMADIKSVPLFEHPFAQAVAFRAQRIAHEKLLGIFSTLLNTTQVPTMESDTDIPGIN